MAEQRITSPVFQTWNIDDGLPSGHVSALARGPDNYMWIGTREGLVRFDGSEFVVLRHDPKDPNTILPSNSIESLFTDSHGHLWVALEEGGILVLDANLKANHRYNTDSENPLPGNDVWAITEACDGSLWLGFYGNGLARLWPDTGQIRLYPPKKNGLNTETVLSLLVDSQCRLWVGTWGGGLFRLQSETGQFVAVAPPAQSHGSMRMVTALMQDKSDRIWVGARDGLAVIDPLTLKPTALDLQVENTRNKLITDIHQDMTGLIWITTKMGIFQFSETGELENRFLPIPGLYGGLPTDYFWAIAEDHEHGVWFGSLGQGVARLGVGWQNFQRLQRDPTSRNSLAADNIISTFWDQKKEKLWAGTMSDGLNLIDPVTLYAQSFKHQSGVTDSLIRERVRVMFRDSSGRLWLGHSSGLSQMLTPGHFKHWMSNSYWQDAISDSYVSDIDEDRNGNLWLALYGGGVILFAPEQGAKQFYGPDAQEQFQLADDSVNTIEIASDGVIWLGGDDGLQAISSDGKVLDIIDEYKDQIIDMKIVEDGTLWVASRNNVSQYRLEIPHPVRLRQYTRSDGLPAISANGITMLNKEIWVTTRRGLVRIRPDKNEIRVFGKSDGLPSVEFEERTFSIRDNKRLYAGTVAGIITFEPGMLIETQISSSAKVYGVRTLDAEFQRTEKQISLNYDTPVVTFEFGALTFSGAEQLRYRYRLLGLDSTWVETRGITERSYSRLTPGKYIFELQSSSSTGSWPDKVDRTSLLIKPPPWLSWQAYLLYALILLVLIVILLYRLSMERKRQTALSLARYREQSAESQRQLTRFLTESLDLEEIMSRFSSILQQQLYAKSVLLQFRGDDLPEKPFTIGDAESLANVDWISRFEEQDLYQADWAGTRVALGNDTHAYIAPLAAGEELLGLAVINGGDKQPFTTETQAIIRLYTKVAGSAIQNARLFQRVQRLAKDADSANAAKSGFLATMSHEIRTPLNGVLGMSELLSETDLSPQQRSLVESLRNSGDNLLRVLNEVLDLSKVESGVVDINDKAVNLNSLLEQVITLYAGVASQEDIELIGILAADVPLVVSGDPARLEQVISNLINNAIKFTDAGYVVFGIVPADDKLRLKFFIRDTGIGLDVDQQEKIFDAFEQADQSANRRFGGTGLGLTISQKIVNAMGGNIHLESELGEGSCFHFNLDLPERGDNQSDWMGQSGLLLRQKVKLLLDQPLRESIESYLERWSIPVQGEVNCLDQAADKTVDTLIVSIEEGFANREQMAENAKLLRQQYPNSELIFLLPVSFDPSDYLDIPHCYTCQRPVTMTGLAAVLMEINLQR